ncbi:XRE family transcriptional regulator [Erwinia aphidicola]|uniref:XRE family transcriptional regulator n=1 Tax=Erwinia aphidicola TaxID=68334 RepID=UPI0030172348
MTTANINPAMLSWARERSGIAIEPFAHKCGTSPERLQQWEEGKHDITFKQAMTFADKAHVPFGYLFLTVPPVETLPIPDLRTLNGKGVQRPSAELLDLLKIMLQRQEWYREYLQQQFVAPANLAGRFSSRDDVVTIVQDMRFKLGVKAHPTRGDWETYYRDLVQRIEAAGVLVMRSSSLGHHSRPFHVEEFRGFAIADDYAPIIFVNHADAPGARLFTLIHELCHIWIGQSGVSDGGTATHLKEEILCNAVAAEFLVPATEFLAHWQPGYGNWQDNLPHLEQHFHVSRWALARRALTLQLIDQQEYELFIHQQQSAFAERDKGAGSPGYYRTKKAQISTSFSRAVVSQALSGQLLLRDAGDLLDGMKPASIARFAQELGL